MTKGGPKYWRGTFRSSAANAVAMFFALVGWVTVVVLAALLSLSFCGCATLSRECYLRCERQHNVCLATGEGCGEARDGCAGGCHE